MEKRHVVEPHQLASSRVPRNGGPNLLGSQSTLVKPFKLNSRTKTMSFDLTFVRGFEDLRPRQSKPVYHISYIHPLPRAEVTLNVRRDTQQNFSAVSKRCLSPGQWWHLTAEK